MTHPNEKPSDDPANIHVREDAWGFPCPFCQGVINKSNPLKTGREPDPFCFDDWRREERRNHMTILTPMCPHCRAQLNVIVHPSS
jgi:hypothetical protein